MERVNWIRRVLMLVLAGLMFQSAANAQKQEEMKFTDIDELMLIGKGFDQTTVKYGRVPEELKAQLRPELLNLGSNSAGLAVRFNTNSSYVGVKWTVMHNVSMNHMPFTGIKGMDLYVLENGKWHYVGTARPNSKENFAVFVKGMTRHNREYIAYLPLYDGVEKVEIGVEPEAQLRTPQNNRLVKSDSKKPILFYGTSITQGGCASRPGMAYPSILSRMLDRETINLGFSGNGRMDFSMAKAINMTDVSAVVLDCLPNTTAQSVRDSAYNFIKHILEAKPGIPLVMIENPNFPYLIVDMGVKAELEEENQEWRELFATLVSGGYTNVTYVRGDNLLGEDGETTVDGVHFTDLGFLRYAEALLPYFKEIFGLE
ncbi:MAG: SGNH/GDSL hydrolase family protein [Rikenellaceae bacterium]|nr:SGNH/GDSL hydrolase family protein [Rikenellaceae bacterium]